MRKVIQISIAILMVLTACQSDKKQFNNALIENNLEVYFDFINNYPNSIYVDSSLIEMYDLLRFKDSLNLYEIYVSSYINTPLYDTITKLIFSKFIQINSISHLDLFIEKYRDSYLVDSALKIRYFKTRAYDSIEIYKEFIEKYPNCKYVSNAEEKIYDINLAKTFQYYIINGFDVVKSKFPNNRFSIDELNDLKFNNNYKLSSYFKSVSYDRDFGIPDDLFMTRKRNKKYPRAKEWCNNLFYEIDISDPHVCLDYINFMGLVIKQFKKVNQECNNSVVALYQNRDKQMYLIGLNYLVEMHKNSNYEFVITNAVIDLYIAHKYSINNPMKLWKQLSPLIRNQYLQNKLQNSMK